MAWLRIPGVTGKVYVPEATGQIPKKHPCKACFACQWCDETRCQVCRSDDDQRAGPAPAHCCGRKQCRQVS